MYPYMNEDAAFERLKDLQREAENRRLVAAAVPSLGTVVRDLVARAWLLGGLAMRRAPRARPPEVREARLERAPRDVA